jgi:hypothetical protein
VDNKFLNAVLRNDFQAFSERAFATLNPAQCPAAEITQAAELRQRRSADLCRTVWLGAERAERLGDRQARNRSPLASRGFFFACTASACWKLSF